MGQIAKVSTTVLFVCVLVLAVPPLVVSWVSDGTIVCDAPENQEIPVIAPDWAGGAIIVWEDNRTTENEIYAQRIDGRGAPLWGPDDVVVCDAISFQFHPQVASDGTGGAFITWVDRRDGDRDIYAQRVDPDGNMLWAANGISVCVTDEDQENQRMTPDGQGGFIVVWSDKRENGTYPDIYAQRVGADGTMQWANNGAAVCDEMLGQDQPFLVSDGAAGAVIIWSDYRNNNRDVFAQRMSAGGGKLWESSGVAVVELPETQLGHAVAPDGSGGAIVTWYDQRDTPEIYIYAQRIGGGGTAQWTANGVTLSTDNSRQYDPSIASDGAGGAIIAWEQGLSSRDIHAQRISAGSALLWTAYGVNICSASYQQQAVQVQSDGTGGAMIVWEDARDGNDDYYAQKVDADGNSLWTANGTLVCSAPGYQDHITFTADGAGGTIFTWEDNRIGPEPDIYAALLDGDGELVPTLLQSWNAGWRDWAVSVEWAVRSTSEVGSFTVERREMTAEAPWEELPTEIEGCNGSYRFVDETCRPGSSYRYRVYVSDGAGRRMMFETEMVAVPVRQVELYQNYPNPFNPSTAIRYYLPNPSPVRLSVYDSSGRLVATLIDGEVMTMGSQVVTWNGRNDAGETVASGIYFCLLRAGKQTRSMKIILMR